VNDSRKAAIIGMLKQVGEALRRTIGPQSEVVIHDLADVEHSIVWIMGTVTERRVGGCLTARGVSLLRSGKTQDNYNFTTRTIEGKMVRSSLVFIKDERGHPFACVEINFDASPFVAFRHTLETLADPPETYDFQDDFIDEAPRMLEKMLQKAVGFIGRPVPKMNKADRLRVVEILDEAGAFELRKAVPAVAGYLGVTRFTIHNYLKEIRERATPGSTGDEDAGS
jgi:predicted transcriptional regulator YheO